MLFTNNFSKFVLLIIMEKIENINSAIDLLNNYNGDNPYLLELKNDVIFKRKPLNEFNIDYINRNYGFKPKLINKTIKVTEWYAKKLQEDWLIDFLPEKIFIKYLLGETENTYHCLIKYRKSMDYIYAFLNKKGVMTNFMLDDYHDLDIDFDRYDKLSALYKPDIPRKIKEHQKEGIKFLLSRKKCILADDMGLAKTAQLSIAAVEGNFDCVLVICPASLKTNWYDELTYYVNSRDITIIGGITGLKKEELEKYLGYGIGKSGKNVSELQAEAKELGKWKENRFAIVNYDILDDLYELPKSRKKVDIEESEKNSKLLQFIKDRKALLIIDEAHRLSNMKSQQYKIISHLIKRGKPDSVYLATGTPITNDPMNYYNILSLIENDITADWQYYMERYCGAIKIPRDAKEKEKRKQITDNYVKQHFKNSWYDLTDIEKKNLNKIVEKNCKMITIPKDASNLDELMERTKHIYLRRTKEDFNDLPPKYVHEYVYDLTEEQQDEYNRLWEEYVREKNKAYSELEIPVNEDDELIQNVELNKNLVELNKNLLEGALYRKYLSNQMIPHTIELTDKCLKRGEKVIIACCYDEELYTLRDYYKDICVIYNGKITSKEKDEAKIKFMTDDSCKVFIGNIIAAGVGLTLTASRIMIFNNFDWVPGNCRQMEDRIYRIGQTRDCHIFYQFFKNTQYEKMWNTVLRKELVINQIIKKEEEK